MDKPDNTLVERVASLEKSVQRLNNIAWVIGIVAGIFGLGGAFGYSAFTGAKDKLANLESSISSVDSTVDQRVKKKEEDAATHLRELAKQLLGRFATWGPAKPQNEAEKDVVFGGRSGRSEVFYCPDGHYVVGMQVIDNDGGDKCVSCINGVRFVCRPINY